MPQPAAKFFPQNKMDVDFGSLVIHCSYWVEWGDDRWHVKIERVVDATDAPLPAFERLKELVAEALDGAKSRLFVDDGRTEGPSLPATASQRPIQPPVPTRGNGPKIV